jgi:uncharacterized protein
MRRVLSLLLLLWVLVPAATTLAQNQDPPIPMVTKGDRGWVDTTGTVPAVTLDNLRDQSDIIQSKGFQLAGAFFNDVASDPSKFASDFGNKNGIGSATKDNGLVIIVLLNRAGTDGHKPYIFVAPGKGLEGLLNDAKITRFRENYFNKARAEGKWEEGLITLATKFAEYLSNPQAAEFSDANLGVAPTPQAPSLLTILIIIALVLLVLIFLMAIIGNSSSGGYSSGGGYSSSSYSSSSSSSSSDSSSSDSGGSYGGGGSFGGGGSGG